MLTGCDPAKTVQLFPSADVYAVKSFPFRTSFIRYGRRNSRIDVRGAACRDGPAHAVNAPRIIHDGHALRVLVQCLPDDHFRLRVAGTYGRHARNDRTVPGE